LTLVLWKGKDDHNRLTNETRYPEQLMAVSCFFKQSLVFEDDEEYTEAPSGGLNKIEETKACNCALVNQTQMFRISRLCHNQGYICDTSNSD